MHSTQRPSRAYGATVKHRIVALAFAVLMTPFFDASVAAEQDDGSSSSKHVTISNVRIIDLALEKVSEPKIITVKDGTITEIQDYNKETAQTGSSFDANGAFAMPGLFDMHVHLPGSVSAAQQMGPLFVANGVTSVRDMGSGCWEPCKPGEYTFDDFKTVAKTFEDGETVGPRVRALSTPIVHGAIRLRRPPSGGASQSGTSFYPPFSEEDGRELADWAKETGFDQIKVYNSVPRAAYFGILKRAKEIGIDVTGHLPRAVTFEEAIEAGQRTFEHARAPALGCSSFGSAFSTIADDIIMRRRDWSLAGRISSHLSKVIEAFDPERCNKIFDLLKENDAYLTPTHVTRAFDAGVVDPAFIEDARLRYIPSFIQLGWFEDVASTRRTVNQIAPPYKEFYEHGLGITKRAYDAQVSIMAGSDAGDSYIFPGFSLHDELASLVRVGVSEGDALRSATLVPARYLGIESVEIAEGNAADILILSSNPLNDISATKAIEAVILRGTLFTQSDLDKMLEDSEALALSPQFNLKVLLEVLE